MLKNRASILEFLYSLGPNEPQELESQFRGIQRELSKMNHLVSPSIDKWMFDDSHPRQIVRSLLNTYIKYNRLYYFNLQMRIMLLAYILDYKNIRL